MNVPARYCDDITILKLESDETEEWSVESEIEGAKFVYQKRVLDVIRNKKVSDTIETKWLSKYKSAINYVET